MKFQVAFFLVFILNFHLNAQPLANENLAHLYNPDDEINFNWRMMKSDGKMKIDYTLAPAGTGSSPEMFFVRWEERDSFSQKSGSLIQQDSILLSPREKRKGSVAVDLKEDAWLLVINITMITTSKTWSYPFLIEKNYPVNGVVKDNEEIVLAPYVTAGKPYTIEGPSSSSQLFIYYYARRYMSPLPPFSANTGGVDPLLLPDSTFSIKNKAEISFASEGLYLVQADTNSAEGFSFRVNSGAFPKYTRIEDLIQPMVFVSTKEEFATLQNANGDKVTFDKTVLGITRDKERARRFMRSYFNRVELANLYFSSYKEGWKTDKGMIFIIFGLPDEIRKTSQNEIWYYKNTRTRFVFIKRGSVYDPNYYVLQRDDKFAELWYNTVDLWRKSRF